MKRFTLIVAAAMLVAGVVASPASAEFGLKEADMTFTAADGSPSMQAGSHPFAQTVSFNVNTEEDPELGEIPLGGGVRNQVTELPEGFVGNPYSTPRCSTADFLHLAREEPPAVPDCPDSTVVGRVAVRAGIPTRIVLGVPVFNLVPPPGVVARFGFLAEGHVIIDVGIKEGPPYNLVATVPSITQHAQFFGADLTLWGDPADPAHDNERGQCGIYIEFEEAKEHLELGGSCPVSIPRKPFLTMPRSCVGPITTLIKAESWLDPGIWSPPAITTTHDNSLPPGPLGISGCTKLGFNPRVDSEPTTDNVESPSGLDFSIDVADEGLVNPSGLAHSDIKKAVVTLPEGVTINPSVAEGLRTCSREQFDREKADSEFGSGCPAGSKIGSVEVESPLLEGRLFKGSVFLATQDDPTTTSPGAENPFDSLIALYLTVKDPELGIDVNLAGKVEPDPRTGELVTTFDDIPQLPFSHFRFHFREGGRSPLVTPPACGIYTTKVIFTPWANPTAPYTTTSSFKITRGVAGSPCPSGGIPPFRPGFEAGSINNDAKAYSPFYMRLIRSDGEQDMTKFSSILPPGVLGKLAGISKCPDSALDVAKSKTGRQEIANPSCPANSKIGHILAGAGVGSALTYVGGSIYLGGPYHGDPLSVVVITPGVAGPFDAGTIVTREALTLNPETAEVEVDGKASDPIPHILKGIVLKVRDIRVYVDRPEFIINPTSCDPSSAKATLFGGYLDVFSAADDVPVDLSSRYQAANCLNLGFKPKLSLQLNGGTKRGGHPALKAVLDARPGDANIGKAVVTLPKSAFLDQGHIRTICTRVQFAAKNCPAGAQYGYAKAITPLLEEPVEGPVYLRSSNHKLPDLVAALHGLVDVNIVGRIDSYKGGIRSSFETVPDAPVTKFTLTMQGGKKGLVVNSRNLCAGKNRASAQFTGQNGVPDNFHPLVKASCHEKRKH